VLLELEVMPLSISGMLGPFILIGIIMASAAIVLGRLQTRREQKQETETQENEAPLEPNPKTGDEY
jgi:hypothetical protein